MDIYAIVLSTEPKVGEVENKQRERIKHYDASKCKKSNPRITRKGVYP
jgi:hypothetical protein